MDWKYFLCYALCWQDTLGFGLSIKIEKFVLQVEHDK